MKNNRTDKPQPSLTSHGEYEYVTAGIREKPGRIPVWLLTVIFGLFIWGGYYLMAYWNPQ